MVRNTLCCVPPGVLRMLACIFPSYRDRRQESRDKLTAVLNEKEYVVSLTQTVAYCCLLSIGVD